MFWAPEWISKGGGPFGRALKSLLPGVRVYDRIRYAGLAV
ncbi:hypothetical protein HMPREF3293_02929 [Christensenella minuta]|uniref:Uncharacterized protein n=1 Tax=Christensenella minuta TaxID=626937 RepID=A0A136Q0S1_9FIRM|nr:hypothetical protein HMPREF3293_02929 [Christensenella minuta]